jgi:AbrB family looped-hinge helix DNA binding protein
VLASIFRKQKKVEGKLATLNHTSVVSGDGRVTIPREIRRRMGLKGGDRVAFVVRGDLVMIRPVRTDNPFEAYVGVLDAFPEGVEGINAWVADLRNDE